MFRLFLTWAVLTGALFTFYYFVDRSQKREVGVWARRILWCAAVPAIGISIAIFLERL